MSEEKIGTYTTYHKIRLYTKQLEYFNLTSIEFNKLVLIYYNVILKHPEVLENTSYVARTIIEKMTMVDIQTGKKPEDYFETNAPSRIRRSACTQAIAQAKAYTTKVNNANKNKTVPPNPARKFNLPIQLTKELYTWLDNKKIKIKLYDGKEWKWNESSISKWNIPKDANLLSPKKEIKKKVVMLVIPEKCIVKNLTTIKERIENNKDIRICGVAFSGRNNIATCVIIDKSGRFIKAKFINEGNKYKNIINRYLRQIQRSENKSNRSKKTFETNRQYWEKISKNANYYSNLVSRKIVDFCKENRAEIIALSNIQCDTEIVTCGTRYNSSNLRNRITKYTKIKSFMENILMTFVDMKGKTNKCYKCNELIERNIEKKTKKTIKEDKAICESGHMIDYFFNFAMNIALNCLKKYS